MDLVIDSPLNKAHTCSRRADLLAERGRLDEASLNHEEAAAHLLEALKLTINPLALESISLQREYHVRQQHLISLKKKHLLAVAEAARVEKEVLVRVNKMEKRINSSDGGDGNLQKAIYRTFDEADSLLELLQKKDGTNDATIAIEVSAVSKASAVGIKKPKDDSDVIEELKFVNNQLRNLITQLMTELANSEKHVAALKRRVAELEGERVPSFGDAGSASSPFDVPVPDESSSQPSPDLEHVDLPPLALPAFKPA